MTRQQHCIEMQKQNKHTHTSDALVQVRKLELQGLTSRLFCCFLQAPHFVCVGLHSACFSFAPHPLT